MFAQAKQSMEAKAERSERAAKGDKERHSSDKGHTLPSSVRRRSSFVRMASTISLLARSKTLKQPERHAADHADHAHLARDM
jgi:hypothetical protein